MQQTDGCVHASLSFSAFLIQTRLGHGTMHRFFWCWNRNSGDTGGLVAEDWATLEWEKLAYLSLIGLRPWLLDWVRHCTGFAVGSGVLISYTAW
jgi:hypothetical protein